MVEARRFNLVTYTDHKLLTFVFHQKPEKYTPCQFRHLDFIEQFTTDIRHITGPENITADTLSRVETMNSVMSYEPLAKSQQKDQELKIPRSELHLVRCDNWKFSTISHQTISSSRLRNHTQSGTVRDQNHYKTHSTTLCMASNEHRVPRMGTSLRDVSTIQNNRS